MGQRFYLAMTKREIDALGIKNWQRTILHAMRRYGLFIGDTGGSGWGFKVESGASATSFGRPDPWAALGASSGFRPTSTGTGPLATRSTSARRWIGRASSGCVPVRESRSLLTVARPPSAGSDRWRPCCSRALRALGNRSSILEHAMGLGRRLGGPIRSNWTHVVAVAGFL